MPEGGLFKAQAVRQSAGTNCAAHCFVTKRMGPSRRPFAPGTCVDPGVCGCCRVRRARAPPPRAETPKRWRAWTRLTSVLFRRLVSKALAREWADQATRPCSSRSNRRARCPRACRPCDMQGSRIGLAGWPECVRWHVGGLPQQTPRGGTRIAPVRPRTARRPTTGGGSAPSRRQPGCFPGRPLRGHDAVQCQSRSRRHDHGPSGGRARNARSSRSLPRRGRLRLRLKSFAGCCRHALPSGPPCVACIL